ncbi:MAG: hypothetical protein KJ944_10105 [Alphaproteobacteria bacterium]|nr:hypothetical protein [Alphaproteobacteria bacterium]MBU1560731.1 hypothetical protein [Alphaproteobacteria bacterium]MBU2302940.1 hypothetical protein [Alphaproteobacteria bacterium]MBU2367667.1 hypothetical protein [Alphaproteobacteria bacterium]
MFETLLRENELEWTDRMAVVTHTVRAIVRYHWGHFRSGVGEVVDTFLFRVSAGGRVPRWGMTPILAAGDFAWYQVTDWGVAQRVRRAFGRVSRRNDCTTLYCGWRHEVQRGEPLPVFVLLDRESRVLEVAYADVGGNGIEALLPGIGADLRPSQPKVVPALQALASWLGVMDFDEQLHWFTGP